MSLRAMGRLLGLYAVVLAIACVLVRNAVALSGDAPSDAIESVWVGGKISSRVVTRADDHVAALEELSRKTGQPLIIETIVGEGPIVTWQPLALALSLVPGRDGIKATFGEGQVQYVTPDDLLAAQAYDHGASIAELGLAVGVDERVIFALLAERLGVTVADVRRGAKLRRIRVVRTSNHPAPPQAEVTADTLTPAMVRESAIEAARYLARGIRADGRFRYDVDAPSNKDLPGYDWPRHAGATYFLAQAAALSHEPELGIASLRAASLLSTTAVSSCGDTRCIGTEDDVEIGSSALTLIAISEITRTGLSPTYGLLIADLARFLRQMQRADGEFMHRYSRRAGHAIDIQYLYFSGEAGLALSRAHKITHDPADLEAASRALAHLVGPAWHFFGDRYYFGEEHWTCQLMADLWDRAPNPAALDFCLRWQSYGRSMQYGPGETAFDADGAYGAGPVVTPRLTPVASRCEAGVATLEIARRVHGSGGASDGEAALLDRQLRRSLALLVRQQLRPGQSHLFADPSAVRGAMPGSQVDWQLRIDYAQHAGSAMIRWLDGNNG